MNEDQYHHCIRAYSDALFRFALKNLKDRDEAKEIVQSSFEKLWIRKENVDATGAKSYLFTMAYNSMVDYWRRMKRMSEIDENIVQQTTKPSEYRGLKEIINRALEQIPEIQRTVILLRDYEGYSYEEIGGITGLNESQVKVYIFRGRQTLKTIIGSLEAVL